MSTYGPNRVLMTGDSSYDTGPHNTQNKGMGRLWAILEQRTATGKKLLIQIITTPDGWGAPHHPPAWRHVPDLRHFVAEAAEQQWDEFV